MAAPTIIPRSTYYDGPVTEGDRAKARAGEPDFTVGGADHLTLSAHPTIPFALVVKKGTASAFGVTAFVETAQGADLVVQCDSQTSGTRWDIITVRYDWRPDAGGPSDIRAVNAGGKQIPSSLEKTPGSLVDQPVWLVRWTGNASAPAEYVDLRCFAGNGGMMANDALALKYLFKPGATVRIGESLWVYQEIGNTQWDWRSYPLKKPYELAEFVYSFTARTGVNHGIDGGIVFDTVRSANGGFASLPGGFLEVDREGDYVVSFHNDWGGAAADSYFLALLHPDGETMASINASTGAGSTTLPGTPFHLRPGSSYPGNRLALRIRQNSGGNRLVTGRIKVLKVA
jgi:hypothetical protein